MRHLLVKGANPNATDNKGQSVMSLAVHNNSHLVIRELFLHGIPIDTPMLMQPQQIKALNTLRTIKAGFIFVRYLRDFNLLVV